MADTPLSGWPDLQHLTALPGPEWRLSVHRTNSLCFVRAFEHYVETVWMTSDGVVAVNRQPIVGRAAQDIAVERFAGTLRGAIEFLRRPPRWQIKQPPSDLGFFGEHEIPGHDGGHTSGSTA